MTDLAELLERVKAATEADNSLDVEIEVATFQPDELYSAARSNAAGTKVIYTFHGGVEQTCWAWDWTLDPLNRQTAIADLTALIARKDAQ